MLKLVFNFFSYLLGSLALAALLLFVLLRPFQDSEFELVEPATAGQIIQANSAFPIESNSLPSLKAEAPAFESKAFAAYAIEITSKKLLYEKNIHERWATASLAKLMTALVALELRQMDETLEVEDRDIKISLPRMELEPGEKISLESLLSGMLIASANDAAQTIARSSSGSTDQFVGLMNEFAKAYGMRDSAFDNPAGFDSDRQYTTAYDVSRLALKFLQNQILAEMVSTQSTSVRSANGNITHRIVSTNQLLGKPGVKGIKTGFTDAAKGNLVTRYIHESGHEILIIVLGSDAREQDTEQLLTWILDSYEYPPMTFSST